MPNLFAYIVLFASPIVIVWLFRTQPIPRALALSIVGGYLFLPLRTGLDLPLLPSIDKYSIPSLTAALMCYLVTRRKVLVRSRSVRSMKSRESDAVHNSSTSTAPKLLLMLVGMIVISPWITVFQNTDPIIAGRTFVPGLRVYDALSISMNFAITLLPYFLARRFFATEDAQWELVRVIVGFAVVYSFLVLFESRFSPQLNTWTYGFFPHEWIQHLRGGGFRPVVFLEHGLSLAIFMAAAFLLSVAAKTLPGPPAGVTKSRAIMSVVWLGVALVFCRSMGALMIGIVFAGLLFWLPSRLHLAIAAAVSALMLTYPLARGAGLLPTEGLVNMVSRIDEDRAASLQFRFDNEEMLLDRANLKPLGGWGIWGRNRVYDPVTGEDLNVPDGAWIVITGQYGWLGYLGLFGLLTLPAIMLWRNQDRLQLRPVTIALVVVVSAWLIDLIPNASLSPVLWLLAGAASAPWAGKAPARG